MKKGLLRWITVLLGTAVIGMSLTGCGGGDATGGKTKISILFAENANCPFNDNWITMQKIREKFPDVELEIQRVPDSDYSAKRQVMLSSGDAPDIITKVWSQEVSEFTLNGVLAPLSDYEEKMPNYKALVKKWEMEDEIKEWREDDGKLYVLPGMKKNMSQDINLAVRKDLFKKYGLPVPTTYEELFEGMKVIKENEPQILGLSEREKTAGPLLSHISRSFGTNGGYSLPYGYTYEYENKKWVFAPSTEEYRELLRYLNKLYKNKLFDPESFSQDTSLFNQKLYSGQVVAAVIWNGEQVVVNDELKKQGVENPDFDVIKPLAGPTGLSKTKSSSRLTGGICVPQKTAERKDFDKILEFIDWLYYSDEGITLNNFGVEGETYTKENDKIVLSSNIKCGSNPSGTSKFDKDYGVGVTGLRIVEDEHYSELTNKPSIVEFNKMLVADDCIPKDDPILKLTEDEKEEQKLIVSNLSTFYQEAFVKFVNGTLDVEADWDNYVKELENKGSKQLMSIVNSAWERQSK